MKAINILGDDFDNLDIKKIIMFLFTYLMFPDLGGQSLTKLHEQRQKRKMEAKHLTYDKQQFKSIRSDS